MSAPQWVAIIDDDDSLRRSLVRLLLSLGVDARGYGSAEAFRDCAAEPRPVCAVVDLYLGQGLNGYDLKELLDATGRSLPMVFMTAQAELPIRMQADEAAVASCLHKPFSKEELIARLAPMVDAFRDAHPPSIRHEER